MNDNVWYRLERGLNKKEENKHEKNNYYINHSYNVGNAFRSCKSVKEKSGNLHSAFDV